MDAPPERLPALLRESHDFERAGDYRRALESALQARELIAGSSAPAMAMVGFELCERLRRFGEIEAMVACAASLVDCRHPGVQAALGTSLSLLGQTGLADALLRKAVEAVGRDPPLVYSIARLREFSGDLSAAEAGYREVLGRAPDDAFAHWSLAKLGAQHGRPEDLARVRASLQRAAPESRNEAVLHYALFILLDRAGQIEEGWAHLARANALMQKHQPRQGANESDLIARLLRVDWPRPMQREPRSGAKPIFIVGLHRTGSTLLESRLGAQTGISAAGELHDFPAQLRWACNAGFHGALDAIAIERVPGIDFGQLGNRYLDHVQWLAHGRGFVTDKLPMNYLNIGFIASALPEARIVHISRDPMDTCFSNLKEPVWGPASYGYDQLEMAEHFAQYRKLMAHWRRLFPGRIIDVEYADLVSAPDATVNALLERAAIPGTRSDSVPAAAGPANNGPAVTTASSAQVRGGVHRRGMGAWIPYAAQLEPMRARLQQHGFA